MSMNKNNTPEIIDSYEGYNLYKDTYGGYIAKHDFPLYVESISFSDDSYRIELEESITDYSDWKRCQNRVEEAFEVAEHFLSKVAGHL